MAYNMEVEIEELKGSLTDSQKSEPPCSSPVEENHIELSSLKKLRIYAKAIISLAVTITLVIAFTASGISGVMQVSVNNFYIQILTSVLCIALSISETFLAALTLEAIIMIKLQEKEKNSLRNFTLKSGLVFCMGTILANSSILCSFWVYTVASTYNELSTKSYYLFVFMQLLIGMVTPSLLCTGLVIILYVAQIITTYEFQAESVVPGILSFVSFEMGDQYCTWIIAKFFYFPVDKDDINDPGQKLTWLQRNLKINLSTCFITLILILNSILALMFITDKLFLQVFVGSSCSEVGDEFDCFIHETRDYFNCTAYPDHSADIDCYRFLKLSETNRIDWLGSFVSAIFLFIATEKFLLLLFNLLKTFISFHRSKMWVVMVTIVGTVMVIVSIVCIVIYYSDHNTAFAFLSVLQFSIFSIDVILVCGLLLFGSPMQVYSKSDDGSITLSPLFAKRSQVRCDDTIKERFH